MSERTLTVESSEHGFIPEGASLTVVDEIENQFSGRHSLRLELGDTDVPNRLGRLTVHQMPDQNVWTEVHVGLSREHERVTFEESFSS